MKFFGHFSLPNWGRYSLSQIQSMRRHQGVEPIEQSRFRVKWLLKLQPSPFAGVYVVAGEITKSRYIPSFWLKEPELKIPDEAEYKPHVNGDNSLCLHTQAIDTLPDLGYIADFMVPWVCEWLFHYDIYLCTLRWGGGGKDVKNERYKG